MCAGTRVALQLRMRPEDLARRLHTQAVQVLALISKLPHRLEWQATFAQLCRCAPSASDNYRSACRGRSRREFVSRVAVAADEADETVGWLQIMHDTGIGPREMVVPLLEEAVELRAILAKSYKTSKQNLAALERKKKLARRKRPVNQQIRRSTNQQIYRIPPGCVPAI